MSKSKVADSDSDANPVGRPSSYTDKLAEQICTRIACGEGLIAICNDENMPHLSTVYRWMDKPENKEFRERYARAKVACAETMFFKQQFVAENSGKETIGPDRLKVEVYDRMAARLAPTKYSERYMAAELEAAHSRIDRIEVTFVPVQQRPEPIVLDHDPQPIDVTPDSGDD